MKPGFLRWKYTSSWKLLHKLTKDYLYQHKKLIAVGILGMILTALTTAALTTTLKPIFDDIFIAHKRELLFYVAGGVLLIFVVKGFAEYLTAICMEIIGQNLTTSIQQKLFDHLIFLDIDFFRQRHEGHVTSLLLNDSRTIKQCVLQTLSSIIKEGLTASSLLCVMIWENSYLSMLSFFGLPLVGFLLVSCGRKVRKISFSLSQETASLHSCFQQIFQNMTLVKASHTEYQEITGIRQRLKSLFQHTVKASRIRAMIHPVMEILGGVAIVTVILIGGSQVMSGMKTTGSFLTFITALLFIYRPMKNIIHLNTQLQEGLAAAERVHEVMETHETYEKEARCETTFTAQESPIFREDIVLDHLEFQYPETSKPLFQDLSCRFQGGKRLALVGPSGSGKTTLFYLLLRFYRPNKGGILLGDINMDDMNLQDIRRHIAFVGQDITLFDDTIANNIRYGIPEASDDAIKEAASLAFADEFIEKLPANYDAMIGANGVKLSGGQRQRISLARAFLRNSPILLLDEATSALDTISEKKIQQAIHNLTEERTTLIIAHRLSTIEKSDKIFVMNQGKIIQEGSHKELIGEKGIYRGLALFQNSAA